MPGHPDWQTYANWRDASSVDKAVNVPAGTGVPFGPFTIPHFAALTAALYRPIGSGALEIDWYADAGATEQIGAMVWAIGDLASVSVHVPALSQTFKVIAWNYTALAGDIDVYVQPDNLPASNITYLSLYGDSPLIADISLIGAGLSNTYNAPFVVSGSATVHVNHGSNNQWNAELQYFDNASRAWKRFAYLDGTILGQCYVGHVSLPAAQVRAIVTNSDASARNVTFSLIVD